MKNFVGQVEGERKKKRVKRTSYKGQIPHMETRQSGVLMVMQVLPI